MILIFGAFCVPRKDQHKVLFYGILGALVFRLAFILVGVTLVNSFDWVLYLFGAFLIFTGIKMAVGKEKEEVEPEHNVLVKFFRRFLPVTKGYEGDKFFVKKKNDAGKMIRWATPMFITLIVIETTDILFAVDSIPAVLGITTSAFIVFSSNAFAILGLRSMYFSLAHIMNAFCYLKYALAGILSFVGIKMIVVYWGIHIDVLVSLVVIIVILAAAIVASMLRNRRLMKDGAKGTPGCGPDSAAGEACPALKELRETEEKYHK
jgi:tellurite resistance protein TerC